MIRSLSFIIVFLTLMVSCLSVSNSSAVTLREAVLAAYETHAFFGEHDGILKPKKEMSTTPKVFCGALSGCDVSIKLLDGYFVADWIRIVRTEEFDPKNLISINIFEDAEADNERLGHKQIPTLESGEEVFSEGVRDCNVMSFYTGHVVNRVIIFINKNLDEKFFLSCVMIELSRAVGLVIEPKFELQWGDGGELSKADNKLFFTFMRGYSRLLALHLSKFTLPEMTKSKFEENIKDQKLGQLVGEQINE